jgi:hypothetical protein
VGGLRDRAVGRWGACFVEGLPLRRLRLTEVLGIEELEVLERQEVIGREAIDVDVEVPERVVDSLSHEGGVIMLGKLFRFRIGFALGYLVAVIRRADENDPMIRGLKRVEEGVRRGKDKLAA